MVKKQKSDFQTQNSRMWGSEQRNKWTEPTGNSY